MSNPNSPSPRGPDRRQTNRRDSAGSLERLLRGAQEVFSERGYGAANVNEICARSRVGIGTFYAHFDHKRELLQQVFFDRVVQSGTLAPEHLLDHGRLVAILQGAVDDPMVAGLLRAWYEAVFEEPAIARFHAEWRPQTLKDMAVAIAEAQKRSPSEFARLKPAVIAWTMATLSRELAIHDRRGAPDVDGLARLFEELIFGPIKTES